MSLCLRTACPTAPAEGLGGTRIKDTLDKMDLEILMRDARMNGEMLCDMVQNGIPSDMTGFLCDMEDRLKLVSESYSENNALNRVERELEALKERISDL